MRLDTLGSLLDIREAAHFIADLTADISFEEFLAERVRRDAIERNFITIGEATVRLRRHDAATLARISMIQQIVGLRNILIHEYHEIDYEIVWHTIKNHLPPLLLEVEALLDEGERERLEQAEG